MKNEERINHPAVLKRNLWLNTSSRSTSEPRSDPSPSAPPSLWRCGTARSASGGGSRGGSRRRWGCRSPRRWAPPPAWASPRRTRWRAACTGCCVGPGGKQQQIRASSAEEHNADILSSCIHYFYPLRRKNKHILSLHIIVWSSLTNLTFKAERFCKEKATFYV